MTLLDISGVTKRFGATVALDGVDFKLRRGQVHALIGENGAGKSTLLNILAGAVRPDSGHMRLAGQPYQPDDPLDARRHGIAHIHQELSLCPHLSVSENVLMGAEPARRGWLDRQRLHRAASEILRTFCHPEIVPQRRVAELSIGARQIVEICRALAEKANIILMDEPTSSLQGEDVKRLFQVIRQLKESQISVIYISHFLEEVREIADSFSVLRDGQSVSSGSLKNTSNSELIAWMVGRSVENLFPKRSHAGATETVLEVSHLEAPPEVKDASLKLCRGEIFGIAGVIGAGRSALLRALYGLIPVAAGRVVVRGAVEPLGKATALRRIQQGIGYLSEDRRGEGLASGLPIADNTTLTHYSSCSRWGWLNRRRQAAQTDGWIRNLRIRTPGPWVSVSKLSGGNQQKVMIARLLHQDVDIFLLDEPTRGIDIGSKAEIYEVIARLAETGKAVLMVSSYLPELFGLCDRLAVMSQGRLSPARPIREWTPESVLQVAVGIETPR